MVRQLVVFVSFFVFLPQNHFGQSNDTLIQFSGLVMTSDSLEGVPYVNIYIKSIGRGTVSDFNGFFSLVVKPGDTLLFSHIGYQRDFYTVPVGMKAARYSVIKLLTRDTVNLAETIIYPWPTPQQFKEAFLSLNIPDDDLERAKKNLEREKLKEMGLALKPDANETLDMYARTESSKYYHYGQIPPMNIFNPLAWAEFFKAWKRGDYKKK